MITHVADFLEKSIQKFPDKKLFIEFNGKSITYAEFDKASKALASHIVKQNIYKAPVLIILPKCIDALISFFGIARSGNFYTIIDERTPVQKIEQIVDVLQPKLLITTKNLNINLNLPTIYTDEFKSFNIDEIVLKKIKDNHIDTDLLYVFFTSGSTGIPKGVSISHKSVINYTFWVYETFKFDENEILANQAPLYFDASVSDIYPTIKAGASLHLIPNSLFAFPAKIIEYFIINKINTLFTGPTTLAYFANEKSLNKIKSLQLNKVFFGGEAISNKHLNIWRKCLPNTIFVNMYGPTEATVYCSHFVVDRHFDDNELLPIGKAYKNTQLLIFDDNLNLITPNQVGVKGELYIRGTCLSLGYYNDKEKTKQAFVQNPLHDNYLDLLYKTGDVVAYNKFGELVFYGRIDNQIKYMEHRIELGEIEAVVNANKELKNSACIFKNNEIICFYESEKELDLKNFLKDKLPSYMIPRKFVKIKQFILNTNGKIDRKFLSEMIKE